MLTVALEEIGSARISGFLPARADLSDADLAEFSKLTTELLIVVDYAEESRQSSCGACCVPWPRAVLRRGLAEVADNIVQSMVK